MDADRFDTLARSLTTPRSRRSLARLLGGLGLGGVLSARTAQEAAAALRIGGTGCSTGGQCKTGQCVGDRCSCSRKFPNCKQPTNPCKEATCNFSTKRCVITTKGDGTSCPTNRTCCSGTCVNIGTNPAHCGRCPTACGTGATCVHGACTSEGGCPAGCDGNGYTRVGGAPGAICDEDGSVCTGRTSCDDDSDCPVGSACLVGCQSTGPFCSKPCGPGVD
jgi:hypothetical protein